MTSDNTDASSEAVALPTDSALADPCVCLQIIFIYLFIIPVDCTDKKVDVFMCDCIT